MARPLTVAATLAGADRPHEPRIRIETNRTASVFRIQGEALFFRVFTGSACVLAAGSRYGSFGITIQATRYAIKPTVGGQIASTTQIRRTNVTSTPRYLANPAQTPAIFRSSRGRLNLGNAGCEA